MVIVENLKCATVESTVKASVDYESVVKTDNYTSYGKIKDNVWSHKAQTVKPKDSVNVLPWVHTMISNAKRTLLGIHHMVSKEYIQGYLDEFCYKVSRRYFGEKLIDRLLIAYLSIN